MKKKVSSRNPSQKIKKSSGSGYAPIAVFQSVRRNMRSAFGASALNRVR